MGHHERHEQREHHERHERNELPDFLRGDYCELHHIMIEVNGSPAVPIYSIPDEMYESELLHQITNFKLRVW